MKYAIFKEKRKDIYHHYYNIGLITDNCEYYLIPLPNDTIQILPKSIFELREAGDI